MWLTGLVSVLSTLTGGPEPWDLARLATYRHQEPAPEARIWLDRGIDPVLKRGDRVRVYYRTNVSAYVSILRIDTDGTMRLLYPRSPSESHYARAGRDYRLLFPRSPYWNVDDRPGMGYFFIVTSARPFDFTDFRYSYYRRGWDLSLIGNRVHEDPYLAMDDYVARLVPDWEYATYGLDFLSYSVGGKHAYPRFLCYDCHGFKPYNIWDPYHYTCTNFRVIVYDDPFLYPSRRYRGDRVVLTGRSIPSGPRFGLKERARGEPGTPVVRRTPAEGRDDGWVGSDTGRRRAIPRARTAPPEGGRPNADGRVTPARTLEGRRPVLERRPPVTSRPPTGPRTAPTPRVGASPAPRGAIPGSRPAVKRPPVRHPGGASSGGLGSPPRLGRPGG